MVVGVYYNRLSAEIHWATHLRVSLYLKVVVTEVTFHPELEYRGGVVTTNGCLLGIVTNTHPNMSTTSTTPDVVGKFKSVIKILKLR